MRLTSSLHAPGSEERAESDMSWISVAIAVMPWSAAMNGSRGSSSQMRDERRLDVRGEFSLRVAGNGDREREVERDEASEAGKTGTRMARESLRPAAVLEAGAAGAGKELLAEAVVGGPVDEPLALRGLVCSLCREPEPG